MKKYLIYTALLLSSLLPLAADSAIKNGMVDIQSYDFEEGQIIHLKGEWFFYWNKLLTPRELKENKELTPVLLPVPSHWKSEERPSDFGFGTYRLFVKASKSQSEMDLMLYPGQIYSSARIFLNEREIKVIGGPGKTSETSVLAVSQNYIPLKLREGMNEIIIQVSNFTNKNAGLRRAPQLGHYRKIAEDVEKRTLKDLTSIGALFILSIYFFILFYYYKEDKAPLFFALFCLMFSLRGLVTNERFLQMLIPSLPYMLSVKIEYITIYSAPGLFLLFTMVFFKGQTNKVIDTILLSIGSVLVLTTVVLSPHMFTSLFTLFGLYTFLTGLYIIIFLIYAFHKKQKEALYILISLSVLLSAAAHDILITANYLSGAFLVSRAILVFMIMMSYIIAIRLANIYGTIRKLSIETFQLNQHLKKFVPEEILTLIGNKELVDISEGQFVYKNMTVVFTNIKDFQTFSETNSPEETFNLLNRCFSLMTPVIKKHNGFIDKFIDDCIMALFPGEPADAVNAALDMHKVLHKYNQENDTPIIIRNGIHTGDLMMGTIGEKERIEATVVSKTVNTASRIESFTQKVDSSILISEDTLKRIKNLNAYAYSFMGKIRLRGKQNKLGIYEFFTEDTLMHDPERVAAGKAFEKAAAELSEGFLEKAEKLLKQISRIYPYHSPTRFYLKQIKNQKKECVTGASK